ncbi:hypothetical protein ABTW96_09060 [Nocardia beijingensis]|uniref:hypothetical protein n=1 Tax=Nocardia beijingensis TaxID=95162 RepID=UPI0033232A76
MMVAEAETAEVESETGAYAETRRLAGDIRLFEALREDGFCGSRWDSFAEELLAYGIGVLDGWMGSGQLPEMFKRKKIQFSPSTLENGLLVNDAEFRDSLIDLVVMEALQAFRQRSLDGTGWRADGGASLKTYYIVACLHATVNELNKQRRADERARKSHAAVVEAELARPARDRCAPDPSEQAIDNLILHQHLGELSTRDRNIVWGKAAGYSNREIAEIYGERSARVVEYRWAWLSRTVDWIGRLAGKEPR